MTNKNEFSSIIKELGSKVETNPGFIAYLVNVKEYLLKIGYTEIEADKFMRTNLEIIRTQADKRIFVCDLMEKLLK